MTDVVHCKMCGKMCHPRREFYYFHNIHCRSKWLNINRRWLLKISFDPTARRMGKYPSHWRILTLADFWPSAYDVHVRYLHTGAH